MGASHRVSAQQLMACYKPFQLCGHVGLGLACAAARVLAVGEQSGWLVLMTTADSHW